MIRLTNTKEVYVRIPVLVADGDHCSIFCPHRVFVKESGVYSCQLFKTHLKEFGAERSPLCKQAELDRCLDCGENADV